MRRPIIAALAALVLILGGASAAHAETPDPIQEQVDAILTANPGGTQTGPRTIVWDDGDVILTLGGGFTPYAVGSCPTGYYCAYNGLNLAGSRLGFATCDITVSLSALPGIVGSLANARSTGYSQGLNSSGTALATVYAGGRLNSAPAGITQLTCVS